MVSMAFTKLSSNFSLVDKTARMIIKHVYLLNRVPWTINNKYVQATDQSESSGMALYIYYVYKYVCVCVYYHVRGWVTGPGCHGNVLCYSQLQFLNLPLQRCLQVALIHWVLHEERLEDERHEDTERQQEVMRHEHSGKTWCDM